MLQHVTRSRGWNITEQVNGNIDNEIELGMKILMIKSQMFQVSQKQKEYDINIYGSTKSFVECTGISTAF
jgi:hypothetical protein